MSEQVTLTLAGQDADILLNYCSTEDITGKPSTQLRAPVPVSILNPNGEVNIQKLFDNTMQANWNRQFGLLNKLVLLSDCNQSEFVDASVSRGEQTGIIIAGVPFLLSPIPCPFFPTSFFSFLPSPPPFNACFAGYTSTNSHQIGTFHFFIQILLTRQTELCCSCCCCCWYMVQHLVWQIKLI